MNSEHPIPAAGRIVVAAFAAVLVCGAVLICVYMWVADLLVDSPFSRDGLLADRLVLFVGLSLGIVLLYMLWRLWPVASVLGKLHKQDPVDDRKRRKVASIAMWLPSDLLIGSALVVVCVCLVVWISGAWYPQGPFQIPARQLLSLMAAILLFGAVSFLLLRRLFRPVLGAVCVPAVPTRSRFGLRPRMILWLLMLAVIVITPVLVIDTIAFSELAGVDGTAGSGRFFPASSPTLVNPLFTGPRFATLFLVLLFAGATGWLLGQELRVPAVTLKRHFDRMRKAGEQAVYDRLPVHSTTEIGMIAVAFNQLADRLDSEHERLRSYSSQVTRAEKMRSHFLANVSHELRTPLNSIIGFSDLLLRGFDGQLNPHQAEDVRVINHEGERLLRLITDILLMARFEAGKSVLQPEPAAFLDLLRDAMESIGKDLRSQVDQDVDPSLATALVNVDKPKVVRALVALIEYQLVTKGKSRTRLTARRIEKNTLCIRVDRASQAAPPLEERAKLFEGFRRTITSPGVDHGIALGLPLAVKIAGLHDGKINFVDDGGSTGIELRLPGAVMGEIP